jgi:valyl-tRNA synthetase
VTRQMNIIKTRISEFETQKLCDEAMDELERAVNEHPWYPTVLHPVIEEVQAQLERARANNESSNCTAHSIFSEEYMEFLEAALIGNRELARRKLVQAIAMLLRIGCHLDDYVSHRGTESTEVKP